MKRGFNPPIILFPVGSSLWLSVPPPPPPLRKQPVWDQPFLYIYFVVFSIWQCVVYGLNFDLHLQLQYSKGNNEDITMTYTTSRRGSVLRLTDSNLSMYIELDKNFTKNLPGYRPYTTSRRFCYKTNTSLL